MQRVCVFCGSNFGSSTAYRDAARVLGRMVAERSLGLVYGGSRSGTMGVVADAALEAGGEVFGVIPRALVDKEIAHTGLTDLRIVNTMHERKASMTELADCFVALPGGYGTLDEFFEVVTWAQLGLHRKPCALLNVEGFFDPMIAYLDHAVGEGFLRAEHRALILVDRDPGRLLDRLRSHRLPAAEKWIALDEV